MLYGLIHKQRSHLFCWRARASQPLADALALFENTLFLRIFLRVQITQSLRGDAIQFHYQRPVLQLLTRRFNFTFCCCTYQVHQNHANLTVTLSSANIENRRRVALVFIKYIK
jgi:hypothetical protein